MKLVAIFVIYFAMVYAEESTCPLVGIDYYDYNMVIIDEIENWETCGKLCHDLEYPGVCNFWSYTTNDNRCRLKSSDEGITVADNFISGDSNCYSA